MTPQPSSPASVGRRVALITSAGVAAVLLALCALVSVSWLAQWREQTRREAVDKAAAVASAIDAFDQSSRLLVDRFFTPFRQRFAGTLQLDTASDVLSSAGVKLNDNFAEVDRFHDETGGVATVFARKGDGFLRIATSLKKADGQRAVGTMLDQQSPAYALLSQDRPYVGRTVLFGRHYMTRYEPVHDDAGRVVGVLFIGFDLTPFQASLAKLVADKRLFDSGGLYVVDGRKDLAEASFVFHPTAAGQKVADTFKGSPAFLERLVAAAGQPVRGAAALLGSATDERWAVAQRSDATGWWVVAEVSERESMAAVVRTLRWLWGIVAAVIVLIGLAIAWMMRRWVSRPLAALSTVIHAVADGDLTVQRSLSSRDEIGTLAGQVERMRLQLADTVSRLRQSAESVHTAADEVAMGNTDLSQRTEEQASNVQQTAASMEQLTATIQANADGARHASELADATTQAARQGGDLVTQVVATMRRIDDSAHKIAHITTVIDGIAFQTNLLALNAAVEAARAGEQGRGFAVVAGEVRNLAQRSAEAAKEIKALIGDSVERIGVGSSLVDNAGRAIGDVVRQVKRLGDLVGEISAATLQQSAGIGQIGDAVAQLDEMTQRNAALVEESAAAADSLRHQAGQMAGAVATFRLAPRG